MQTTNFIGKYIDELKILLDAVDSTRVEALVDLLFGAWERGKKVLLMGNGGSGSTASHIVNDLQKSIQLETGRGLRVMNLSDCMPLVMAWANDTDFDNVFAPQVDCWAEQGDVVIGISGSGNSMNVIKGIRAANTNGAKTFGLAGFHGGKLKDIAQQCIVIDSYNMQRVEDVHMILLHIIFCALLERTKSATEERDIWPLGE